MPQLPPRPTGTTLNPTSPTYVPTGFPPSANTSFDSQQTYSSQSNPAAFSRQGSISSTTTYHSSPQIGGYQTGEHYQAVHVGPIDNQYQPAPIGGPIGGHYQTAPPVPITGQYQGPTVGGHMYEQGASNGAFQYPYHQGGPSNGVSQYQYQQGGASLASADQFQPGYTTVTHASGSNGYQQGYTNATNAPAPYSNYVPPQSGNYNDYNGGHPLQHQHGHGSSGSPTFSTATMSSPVMNFQNMTYNAGPAQGISQAWGSLGNRGSSAGNHGGTNHGQNRNGGNSSQSGRSSRNSNSKGKQKQNGSQNGKQKFTHGPAKNDQKSAPSSLLGGPVLLPEPAKATRDSSPARTTDKASRASSQDDQSVHSRQSLASEGKVAETPGTKRIVDNGFTSEPCSLQTPKLRSVRGQSISSATEPQRKQAVSNWIETTPTTTLNPNMQDTVTALKRRASPPKMMSLLAAGSAGASTLRPINENDPFTTAPSPFTRPFQGLGTGSFTSPYKALVGSNQGGMSRHLAQLTQGGKVKPSIDLALDPKNLPFVEYCRMAKNDAWGVIKISNVSAPGSNHNIH